MSDDTESGGLDEIPKLLAAFALISVISFGGGNATLQLIKQITLGNHWLSNSSQFLDIYALGRIAPGPGTLYMVLIGYYVGSWVGALVVFLALFVPAVAMMYIASRLWNRFHGSPWETSIKQGLAPVTVGLILAGTYALGSTAINGTVTALIALGVTVILLWRRVNPAFLVIGAGVIAGILLR